MSNLTLEQLGSEVLRLRRECDELKAALDSVEVSNGLSSNGNLWRFWAEKASKLAKDNEKLRAALGPFAGMMDYWEKSASTFGSDFSTIEDDAKREVPVGWLRAARAALKEQKP